MPATSVAEESTLPVEPPNIVVFYIDDTPPHDASLWNDPLRTPNIYEQFIEGGVDFTNAIGETPLCCPARANLLTGLHTHNHGVIANEAALFDPSEHIGNAMKEAGYASMFIGKYLNRNDELTPEQWAEHDAGWTYLDVTKGVNGSFMNFMVHTKESEFRLRNVHSTQFVADDAIARFRQTPAETPLFAVLSIYNLHLPNRPMAQDIGDTRCANMPPYNPPNYNEADVSDKPTGIQGLPLLPDTAGWPMVRNCESMLGVDRAVGQVVDELEAEGRLDNTLLVFAADNGMAWGAHRAGHKGWPYTTPVPLHMRWPAAGWGDEPAEMPELVSNIDLAPTFCELAQACVLGPFAHGNDGPDGTSLVPLIKGDVPDLGRDAVLEAMYIRGDMSYTALRTTALYDAGNRWHYVEYANGELELYDLVADEWEMDNVASDPAYAEVVASLSARLAELRLEGVNPGTGSIRIVQDTRPEAGVDYQFTGDLGSFTLDDDADPTLPNEAVFSGLPSGIYTVARPTTQAPWVLADIDCQGVVIVKGTTSTVTMYVHPDEEVTCTWIDAKRRPDASIALSTAGPYRMDNLYQLTPTKKQTARRNGVVLNRTYTYRLRIQNDSGASDSFLVRGDPTGPGTVTAAYFQNGEDVTATVADGTCRVAFVVPGAARDIVVRVTVGPGTPAGSIFRVLLRVSSASDPNVVDVVRLVAAR